MDLAGHSHSAAFVCQSDLSVIFPPASCEPYCHFRSHPDILVWLQYMVASIYSYAKIEEQAATWTHHHCQSIFKVLKVIFHI